MKYSFKTTANVIFAALMLFSASCASASAEKKETRQAKLDVPVNVLCYHRFEKRKATDPAKKNGDIYYISTDNFEKHMKFLKDNGYNGITMSAYVDYLEGRAELPDKPVVITIDDGYVSGYTGAFPILKKYSIPATYYVYTIFFPRAKQAMSVAQVKEMAAAGEEVGCHSKTHPILTFKVKKVGEKKIPMTDKEYIKFLREEIIVPRKVLQEELGLPVDTFAYPYGAYSNEVESVIKEAGYKAALSVCPSYNTIKTGRLALKRTIIYYNTTTDKLKKILEMKTIDVRAVYPADGVIITERSPEVSAQLVDDAGLNTATIRFTMGRVPLNQSVYNPQTKMVTYKYTKLMKRGNHIARVFALGLDGTEHEFAWQFMIGRPTKLDMNSGEEYNKTEEDNSDDIE
jgi:peptidoglycan/xylan/chitin deacetylase (PgdA/CDA1 family)